VLLIDPSSRNAHPDVRLVLVVCRDDLDLEIGCLPMKSSAAIFAAVTEPSPPLSEYGPEASFSTPIFIDGGA
jgi:hypothetical protein